jgi:protoporphyrinogen oxidase
MAASQQLNVAVIGGGFTGLTAARRLVKSGLCKVSLIERGPALGGLAGGFTIQGTSLEKAYHHIFRTDLDIRQLVDELGLSARLQWHESSIGIYYGGHIYSFMSPADVLRFKPCNLFNRFRFGAVAFYLQKSRRWRRFAPQSAYHWMRRFSGKQATDVIWGPLLRGKFHSHYDSVSMAWLWARIHMRGNSRESAGAEKLGYFQGGFSVVTDALAAELKNAGVNLLLNTRVEQLNIDSGAPTLFLNGAAHRFDRCLFTGPSSALAELLSGVPGLEEYRRKLESISYLGAINLVFATDQILGDYYWLNINDPNAPFLVLVRHTRLVDPARYSGKQIYYIGSYQPHDSLLFAMPEDGLTNLWFDYLQKIYPHFDRSKILEKHLFKFRHAQHIVDLDYESKIPSSRTPVAGVYLSNFSQVFPEDRGTNFAVRDGNNVADLILKDIDLQRHHA